MPISKIGQHRQVVIPKDIFDELGLNVGDFVEVLLLGVLACDKLLPLGKIQFPIYYWGRTRKLRQGLLLSLLSLLFSAGAAEWYLRAFKPVLTEAPFFVDDRELGFRRVNYQEGITNSLGFKDQDYPFSKDPASYRIVGLGDSFAWGPVAREENYHKVLQAHLNESLTDGIQKFEVINLGVPGYGPHDELVLLKKYGIRFQPDLVILGFFMGNDFYDNEPNMEPLVLNGEVLWLRRTGWRRFHPGKSSYLVHYLRTLWLPLVEEWKKQRESRTKARADSTEQIPPPVQPADEAPFSSEAFIEVEYRYSRLYHKDDLNHEFFKQQCDYVQRTLAEMKSVCEAHGARLVVAIFPDRLVIEEPLWETLVSRYRLVTADYDFEAPGRLLKTFGQSINLPVLDLTPRFRQVGRRGGLYWLRDTHWNQAGNQLAGEEIYNFLISRKLVPAP